MSSRGRGRGRGQIRTGSPDADDATPSETSAPSAGPSNGVRASSVAPSATARPGGTSVAQMLRKNDYTKKGNTPAMKFTPNMVRRKPGQIDLSVVKKEEDEKPKLPQRRPAGRGRGKPMMSEMIASGTFAMGPSQGGPRGGARGGGAGGGGHGGGGGSSYSRPEQGDGGAQFASSDEDDDWDPTQADNKPAKRSSDMSEIYKEDEMAPLVLPRDRGRVLGETEETIKAKDEAQATLPPPPSIMPTVKEEPMDDEESQKALSLDNTPAPESSHASSLAPADEEQKKPTIIKSEQVANGFMQDKMAQAIEQLYVFQFPRHFPEFEPVPDDKSAEANGSGTAMEVDEQEDKKPDIKPTIPVSSGSSQGYAPGKWQDWGKSSGRNGRPFAETKFEGQIGRLRVHASGKVSLVLGSGKDKIRYDILPAAPATFLQEVAVQIPKPMKHHEDYDELPKGLYVMGQTDKKYVVRPNIDQLLRDLDLQKKESELLPVKKEDPEAVLPKGEAGVSDLLAQPKRPAASGATAPAAASGATSSAVKRVPSTRGRGRGRGAPAS